MADLRAERGRKSRAERALIARSDEGTRAVDGKADRVEERHLRQIVDGDAILWERGPDRLSELRLRPIR